jgi:hypothetical protein
VSVRPAVSCGRAKDVDLMELPVRIRNKAFEVCRRADQAWRNNMEDDMSFNAKDFNQVVEKYHLALGEFMKGNPAPAKELYSKREDVTLGQSLWPIRAWMDAGR